MLNETYFHKTDLQLGSLEKEGFLKRKLPVIRMENVWWLSKCDK